MLSRALIRSSQFGQCDGGETIDSPRGTRQMTTFRKLPATAPTSTAYPAARPTGTSDTRYWTGESSRQVFWTRPAVPATPTCPAAFGSYRIEPPQEPQPEPTTTPPAPSTATAPTICALPFVEKTVPVKPPLLRM